MNARPPRIAARTPTRTPAPAYETDFAAWAQRQAALLRAGRFDTLDVINIAEEIDSLGRSDRRALIHQLDRVLIHLLKVRHQPARQTRSWANSIADGRRQIELLLADSPSLRTALEAAFGGCYARARREAARQTGLPVETFPVDAPFTLDEAIDEAFWPQPDAP
jgi:hypothetical protein